MDGFKDRSTNRTNEDFILQFRPLTIKSVLLATDLDHKMDGALGYAISIARHYGAALHAVHVASSFGFTVAGPDATRLACETAERDMEVVLNNLVASGKLENIRFSYEILRAGEGRIDMEIFRSLRTTGADLVVVGTHRKQGIDLLIRGSVAQSVVRNSDVPVLTVGPRSQKIWSDVGWDRIRPILCAAALHESPPRSWNYACSLAKDLDRELILLHVIKPIVRWRKSSDAAVSNLVKGEPNRQLDELVEHASRYQKQVSVRIESGPVAETVLNVASRVRPGLIVMGAHPTTVSEWSARTSHAITQHVQQEACCPVLTVRS